MMGLQRIELKTFANSTIFNISSPSKSDEFIVTAIKGLTSANVNVNFQKTLYADSVHMGSRVEEREITMQIRLYPNMVIGNTVESLRDKIYSHIISMENRDDYTQVILYGSNMDLTTFGRISQIEADLYSDVPTIQLSIRCKDAYLYKTKPEPAQIVNVTSQGAPARLTIFNPGAPVGFDVYGKSSSNFPNFHVLNETNGQEIRVTNFNDPTDATEWAFRINSEPSKRWVRKLGRKGTGNWTYYNAYDRMTITKGFVQLESGENKLVASGWSVPAQTIEVRYTQRFVGI